MQAICKYNLSNYAALRIQVVVLDSGKNLPSATAHVISDHVRHPPTPTPTSEIARAWGRMDTTINLKLNRASLPANVRRYARKYPNAWGLHMRTPIVVTSM